ncbi:MAG: MBL fold metallo-hydrolase, partial [Gemmatimonadales bacterium]
MILKRIYDDNLAQASYLIGCAATKEAIVVDPNRDVGRYLDLARRENVRVTHVTETHIHADFLSGSRELACEAGAKLFLSAEGGEDWQYGFASEAGATLLRDGDVIEVGNIRLQAVHTPGHTPEHLTFLVTDTAAATEPIGALTGDFLFVGDVGRPDLLERAARVEGTMEAAARTLFQSLQAFRSQPEFLQVWPAHGAGSACGKSMSAVPHSTVGYEVRFNWAFGV